MTGAERLRHVASTLRMGEPVDGLTVRDVLHWFGEQRRGYSIVKTIQAAMLDAGLTTDPDFENAYIESPLKWSLLPTRTPTADKTPVSSNQLPAAVSTEQGVRYVGGAVADPTFRIGRLAAANHAPVVVRPDASLQEATTIMLLNDYSQLPVMQGLRDVKGMVSWRTIGSRLVMGNACSAVKECMEFAQEVSSEQSIFSVLGTIVEHDYVLVRQPDRMISGIVTTSDLSLQFRQLAEPFLLLQEIENHLRRFLDGRFTQPELMEFVNPGDKRSIVTIADLSFGEYVRIFENPGAFGRLGLRVDRGLIVARLHEVRQLRNDVMHFDPDPFGDDQLRVLRDFAEFLRELAQIGLGA